MHGQSQFFPYGRGKAIEIKNDGSVTQKTSSLNSGEGCSSIQNPNGDVLFYTNGYYISMIQERQETVAMHQHKVQYYVLTHIFAPSLNSSK